MSRAGKKDIFVSEFDGSMQSGMTPTMGNKNGINLPRFGADFNGENSQTPRAQTSTLSSKLNEESSKKKKVQDDGSLIANYNN